ncbi:hypothetical protein LOTGIDRAFT_157510 [Lottia gigantea]|uniref:PiggyBac transposable element-derived protein domain-containing protein n=1 Tax=Lottia gigantea TaxID=225164 RepID=V4B1V3_LOTGI|nr:hypothetical protein LOTGIDRAFT_157510 [Lottia gigantea]ESP01331.1 hypothetical protein LOTGIDRAFT_157510 [Lottia gigantea]
MLRVVSLTNHVTLTLNEVINILEEDDQQYDSAEITIPPPPNGPLTDEDSADEDKTGILDNLSDRPLNAPASATLMSEDGSNIVLEEATLRRRMYWSYDKDIHNDAISSAMSRDRFDEIQRDLQRSDNSQLDPHGRFSKIIVFNSYDTHIIVYVHVPEMVVVPRDDYDCVSYHKVYQVDSTLDDSRARVVEDLKHLKHGYNYQDAFKTKPKFIWLVRIKILMTIKEVPKLEKVSKTVDIKPDCSKLTEYLYYNMYHVIAKKDVIKPDCGKLADGITEGLDDDIVSKMYDDLLLQLGFVDGQFKLTTTESSKEISDYKNPFKFGYLLKVKPSRSQRCRAGFRRALKAIKNVLTRPFLICRNSKIQPNSEK